MTTGTTKYPPNRYLRPYAMNVRLSGDELAIFRAVAAAHESNIAEVTRVAFLAEAVRLGLEVEPEHQQQEAEAIA